MIVYFNYCCIGCTCGATTTAEKSFVVEKDRKQQDEPEYCPNDLDHSLKLMGEKCTVLASRFSGKLISKEEKVKMLKKRASDDYKKNIHERKVEMTRQAIKKFKSI